MKIIKYIFFLFGISFCIYAKAQFGTFITIDGGGQLEQVTISASGCNSTPLSLCSATTLVPKAIALYGNLLYYTDYAGYLYSTILGTTGTCTNLGNFLNSPSINGLTVDKYGKVYAASNSTICTYDPNAAAGSKFKTLGNAPNIVGGDLLFYSGQLYMACYNNVLLAIDTLNPANSTPYLTFTSSNIYGLASVAVSCNANQIYALSWSLQGTKVISIDMVNKIETGTVCILNYSVFDAASITETGANYHTPPPTVNTPINYCQNATTTPLTATAGTIYWYNTLIGGVGSTTAPTPNTATIGTNTYYLSQKDNTGCGESVRDSIVINVYPHPAVPTINPTGTKTICAGNALTLTSSATSCNQWLLNGVLINGAINQAYSATAGGNYTVIDTLNGNCSKTSIPTTVIFANSSIATNVNRNICQGDSLLFNGTYYKTAGTFAATLANANGCDSVATLNLTVEDFKLTLTATPNLVLPAANLSAQITATAAIASSMWQPSSLFANNISSQTITAPNASFLLKVIATSANGCIDSAKSFITINLVTENIYIPNTFSPASTTSTENKTLKVYGISIKSVSMDIYNQWGNKIATLNNASSIGWDGTSNGKQQTTGVYTYLAKVILLNGKTIIKKGMVNLIR